MMRTFFEEGKFIESVVSPTQYLQLCHCAQ